VPLEVGADKRTHHRQLQASRANVFEGALRQVATDAAALGVGLDLGMDEDDPAGVRSVKLALRVPFIVVVIAAALVAAAIRAFV